VKKSRCGNFPSVRGKNEIRQKDHIQGEQVVLQLTENLWGK
jgi:hypothetical protein